MSTTIIRWEPAPFMAGQRYADGQKNRLCCLVFRCTLLVAKTISQWPSLVENDLPMSIAGWDHQGGCLH
jgi:hypothetical protein